MLQSHLTEAFACHAGVDSWGEYVESAEALWTYDIKQGVWQQRQAVGLLPEPRKTMGLAVANGHAYFLARQDNWSESWRVYELDLDTWESRLLPYDAGAPPCWVRGNPAVFEVRVPYVHLPC